jgi:8-hydroxy-5-deazaflavin:NADPH oxidoreductase
MMKIGILGTGSMGRALSLTLSREGHEVMVGSREEAHGKQRAAEWDMRILGGTNAAAAEFGDVVILAIPADSCGEILAGCGSLEGKIVVDITNALDVEGVHLRLPEDSSSAELIAALAPEAAVVKAFNMVHAEVVENSNFGAIVPTCFYCGDDEEAKAVVAELISDCRLQPVDCGPLNAAHYLESAAGLLVQLSYHLGQGSSNALVWVKR